MLLGQLSKLSIPHLVINYNSIECICGFKLLGVYISNDMSWNLHVDYICARVNARLHYLKRLKRAGLPTDRFAIWYTSVIRPVLEYCAVVWHHGLRKYQTEAIEAIQRRTVHIIYPVITSMPYWVALRYSELSSLSDRCDTFCRNFFGKLLYPSNCIRHLLPPLVTLKSHLGLEEQPRILDPITVLTATNLSFNTPS